MKINICKYIDASDLSNISNEAKIAMNAFFYSDLDVSFGDANRTLIDIHFFIRLLENAMEQQNIWSDDAPHKGYEDIKNSLVKPA